MKTDSGMDKKVRDDQGEEMIAEEERVKGEGGWLGWRR